MSTNEIDLDNILNPKNINDNHNHNNGAVPFITYNESTKKFVISKEARKILSNPEKNKKIGIISLVGKYRTGKSFLLNRVIINNKNNSKDGFEVGPTIKPCTKGIWLWSNPLIVTNENSNNEPFPVYLIDTEGLGAYDEEINHDSKIFLISILISSLFIYNSFGTIDEAALSNLSFILNLSKSLKLRQNKEGEKDNNNSANNNINEEDELAKYFPCLFWLLRDFVLKLVDLEGNPISSKEYLENSLKEQEGTTDTIIEKNLIRRKIKNYFLERDCFPMVRPVENEKDLQNLMNLPDENIRPEFLEQSKHLREMIYTKVKPKNFGGKILSGEMLIELVESIVNAINDGAIPVIENSWKYITNNECVKNIKLLVENFSKNILNFQKNNLEKENFFEIMQKYNEELTQEIINNFKNQNAINSFDEDDIKEHIETLKNNLKQEYKKLTSENINLLKDKYNYELNKEIENIFNDTNRLSTINHISFIGELLQIKDKLDTSIPDFFLKQQISFDKIIDAIKKFIEEKYIKTKNSTEQTIHNLTSQNTLLEEKYKNISEEYNKDKTDFKQTVDKYNDMFIENKLKLKTFEEKIKNFENEKKLMKETQDRNILENNQKYEDKINNLNMEINKLKTEIKTKEEEILLEKLDKDQLSALNMQKITFLENEANKWKERYNEQSKNLSEVKTEKIHLAADIDKLKTEIKNLKNKATVSNNGEMTFDKKMNVTYGNSATGFYTGGARASNKLLIDLLSEQNSIKEFLNEIKNNTNKIIDMNKDIMNNVQNLNKGSKENSDNKEIKGNDINILNNNNINENKELDNINNNSDDIKNNMKDINKTEEIKININNKEEVENKNTENINNKEEIKINCNKEEIINNNNEELKTNTIDEVLKTHINDEVVKTNNTNENELKNNITTNDNNNVNNLNIKNDELKTIDNSEKNPIINDINNSNLNYINNKENITNNNINTTNFDKVDESLKIQIINHVLKKNMSGKPYLDYICEIKNKDNTNKLHRKLMNFYVLHKSLKECFKDKIIIPDKDNLFIEENIKSGALENKQDLLNNYIEEIIKIDEIKRCQIFQNFFEIK